MKNKKLAAVPRSRAARMAEAEALATPSWQAIPSGVAPLAQLLQHRFAEIAAEAWEVLDAAGVTGGGMLARDPGTADAMIGKLGTNDRGRKKRAFLHRHLQTAINARRTIEAIEDRDLFRAVDAAFFVGVSMLRPLAEVGAAVSAGGSKSKENPNAVRWRLMAAGLRPGMSERAIAAHISKNEGVKVGTVRNALRRPQQAKSAPPIKKLVQ